MYQLLLCGLTKALDCLKFVGLEEKKKHAALLRWEACTVVLQEPCLHCTWWGVKLLIWEIKHEAFHIATRDVCAEWSRIPFFFLSFVLFFSQKPPTIKKNCWEDICWDVGCWEGSGAEERGMKADFLLAVLALHCISCPTTAEWDGWLIWTINTVVFNWCHFAPFLSPE